MKLIRDNRGVVPLLTSIFLGVLLSIIAIAFIRLAISERRQATDDDLTTAAFYAAESGLEDAKRAIKQYVLSAGSGGSYSEADLNGDDCAAAAGTDPTLGDTVLNTSYTCQLIDLTPDFLTAKVDAGKSHLFRLEPVADDGSRVAITRIEIKWNDESEEGDGEKTPRPSGDNANLTQGQWDAADFPAMLRTEIFAHRRNDIRLTDIRGSNGTYAAFFNPVANNGTASYPLSLESFDSELLSADCTTASSFTCEISLDVSDGAAPASRYRTTNWIKYLNIQPLYADATIRVQAFNGTVPVNFKDAQAKVDITGQSGDSFRRIETFVPLQPAGFSLPEFTVIGGDRICKDFNVTDTASDFVAINPGINDPATGSPTSCRNN